MNTCSSDLNSHTQQRYSTCESRNETTLQMATIMANVFSDRKLISEILPLLYWILKLFSKISK